VVAQALRLRNVFTRHRKVPSRQMPQSMYERRAK
jgi:hypothetical protein